MISDIRVSTSLYRHWKYKKLKRIIGKSPMEYLIVFWSTIAEQKPNGALNGWSKNDVENAAEWDGEEMEFCDALIESGFLEEKNNCFYPHDWAENQPWVIGAKERSEAARKAGKASASARKQKKGKKDNSTDGQRNGNGALNGIATDGQRSGNPRTPSPSPSPNNYHLSKTQEDIEQSISMKANNIFITEDGEHIDRQTGEHLTPFDEGY